MANTLTLHSIPNKKRVSLNKKASPLVLDYQGILEQEDTNSYTRQLVASALNLPPTNNLHIKPAKDIPLKSSIRTPKSAPCSPTKSVQFDQDNLENICYFKKAQTPLAISHSKDIFWANDDDDDEEEEVKLVLPNWPKSQLSDVIDKRNKVIRIDKSSLKVQDDALTGTILVRNLDYQKTLTIRYTFDYWETSHDIQANYQSAYPSNTTYDIFTFELDLKSDSFYFAVQYKVGTQEFWDNNNSKNYEVQLVRNNNKKKEEEEKSEKLKKRYDFSHSFHQVKQPPAAIPIPRRQNKSPSPTGSHCHSPSSPSMELNSPSYMDLVSKYCFYSSSPTRSPMSTY
ncbi:hypothetical protein G6F56_005488 [Rhizopus delemar]|nr:hypothetical protein G6F56_005488 [Rhizopus delemar]